MKWTNVLTDAATVVGCCVGVGFLCGKEAQIFFGNFANVAIFALCFFALNCILREFCRKNACFDIPTLAARCFGRAAEVFSALFLLCCFVCVVTMLAGVQNCLEGYFSTQLPLYAIAVCLISAYILKKGIAALKILNVVSVVLALAYLATVAITSQNGFTPLDVDSAQPIKYALFSVTMSLGILAPISATSAKHNTTASAIATVFVSLLLIFVLWVADFSLDVPILQKTEHPAMNIFACVTLLLATVTGVVANTLPVAKCLSDVFCDDVLCYTCIFCLAVAFSMFGFDFALKYGYLFVAAVGAMLAAVVLVKLFAPLTAKSKKYSAPPHRKTAVKREI